MLPLAPDAMEILRSRLALRTGSPFVFPGVGRSGHVINHAHAWARILEKADIAGLTRHDLRRSVGTMMASQGASEYQIGAALGHRSLSAVRVYVHLSGETARTAVATAGAALTRRSSGCDN